MLEVIPGKAERTQLRNIMADELENIDQDTGNIAYCAFCGKAFSPVNRNHRYCRPACRTARTSPRSTEEDPSGQRNTARMGGPPGYSLPVRFRSVQRWWSPIPADMETEKLRSRLV